MILSSREERCFRTNTPEGVRQMVVAAVGGTIDDYLDQDVVTRLHLAEVQHFTKGQGVVVAVLDTGVNFAHSALQGALVATLRAPSSVGANLSWDGRDRQGRRVPSGRYYFQAPASVPGAPRASILIVR